MKLKKKVNGQINGIDSLGPLALAIVSLAIIVGVGAIVLTQMQGVAHVTDTVGNETFNATANPYNYTVAQASNSDFVELNSATVYDTEGQSTTLNSEIVDAENGKVEVEGTVDSDLESIEYSYSYEGAANTILGTGVNALETFGSFFTVIVVIGIAAVLFLLLGAVKRAGGTKMA